MVYIEDIDKEIMKYFVDNISTIIVKCEDVSVRVIFYINIVQGLAKI